MIRVVVTGSECTGKTTLARALAERYDTVWAPEYARQFVERKGAAPDYEDVAIIAHGQIQLEERLARQVDRLLVQDCDLLSTVVYSRHYFGDCPLWVEQALLDRRPDLYLLADIDVPWVPDKAQRDRGDRREEMQGLFYRALGQRHLPFVEIRGALPERLESAAAVVDPLLEIAG